MSTYRFLVLGYLFVLIAVILLFLGPLTRPMETPSIGWLVTQLHLMLLH